MRYLSLLILSILFACSQINAQQEWQWLDPIPTGDDLDDIAYGNGVTITCGWLANGIFVKPDGGSWSKVPKLSSFDVQFADGLFRIAGHNQEGKYIKTSPDGVTWTDIPVPEEIQQISRFGYHNGAWVLIDGRSYSGDTYYSPNNGASWTKIPDLVLPEPYASTPYSISYVLDRWFILGYKVFLSSVDGVNWSPIHHPGPASTNYYEIAYGNGFMLATASEERVFKSIDGVNWTVGRDGGHATLDITTIDFNNGVFLVARDGYPGQLEYTSDGIAYTSILNVIENRSDDLAANTQFDAICPWNTGFLVAGDRGFVLATPDVTLGETSFTSLTPVQHHQIREDVFAVSGMEILRYSKEHIKPAGFELSLDNGRTWSTRTTDLPKTLSYPTKIRKVKDKWFALNLYSHSSNDGVNWTVLNTASSITTGNRVPLTDVDHDGNKYIGIITTGSTNSYFATSADGIEWTIDESNRPPAKAGGLRYVGGKYILIGLSSNFGDGNVWTSDDLTNWSEAATINPLFSIEDYQDVLYKEGAWTISTTSTSFYSTDAINWAAYPYIPKQPVRRIVEHNGLFYSSDYNQALIGSANLINWATLDVIAPYDLISVTDNGIFARSGTIGFLYYDELPELAIPEPFRVKSYTFDQVGQTFTINTSSALGEYYILEYSNDPSDATSWTMDFEQGKDGTGETLTFLASVQPDRRFFRVRKF